MKLSKPFVICLCIFAVVFLAAAVFSIVYFVILHKSKADNDHAESSYMVGIKRLGRRPHCGGAIISENWILTAASCFEKEEYSPGLNSSYYPFSYCLQFGYLEANSECDIFIEDIIVNYKYELQHLKDYELIVDLALVRTNKPISLSANTAGRISLNRHYQLAEKDKVFVHENAGSSEDKVETHEGSVRNDTECGDWYHRIMEVGEESIAICLDLPTDDNDCNGCPITISNRSFPKVLVGFRDSPLRNGNSSNYGLMTNIKGHMDWIEKTVVDRSRIGEKDSLVAEIEQSFKPGQVNPRPPLSPAQQKREQWRDDLIDNLRNMTLTFMNFEAKFDEFHDDHLRRLVDRENEIMLKFRLGEMHLRAGIRHWEKLGIDFNLLSRSNYKLNPRSFEFN